ncbi:MAG: sigma-E factor negative regulatory protein [Gammaproteobacteria bacterium]|nr:sigma-E factor negative regulatory protein [Gammaproteobacteria bacterium]
MNKRDQQLSAFLDDDLKGDELNDFLQDLQQDPVADGEMVARYQLIRDVLRDEMDVTSFMDVSASVHRVIEAEDPGQQVVIKTSTNRVFQFSSWLRPLSGMAIAASVAMVTVVAFRTVETDSVESVNQLATGSQQQYIQPANVLPVNADLSGQVQVVSTQDELQDATSRSQQLNEYMLDHSGYAGQRTVHGMMPYVRVVSHGEKTNQ